MPWPSFKVGLALGGGGARGLAHVGVLDVLTEAGLAPDFIVGTSIGAIIGGAYALTPDMEVLRPRITEALSHAGIQRVEKRLGALIGEEREQTKWGVVQGVVDAVRRLLLWNRQAIQQSLIDGVLIAELIDLLVKEATFDDLALPFHAVAFDLNDNSDVVFSKGALAPALQASSAVPGVFEPLAIGDRLLVDGAVHQELPTASARRLGADFVLAVDVGSGVDKRPPTSAAEVLWRVLAIRGEHLRRESVEAADFVITPDVADVRWSEFSRAPECYAAGAAAARGSLESLQAALRRARRRTLPVRFLRRLSSALARTSRAAEASGS